MIQGFNFNMNDLAPMLPGGGPNTSQTGGFPGARLGGQQNITGQPTQYMNDVTMPTSFMPKPMPPAPTGQPSGLLDIFNRPMPQFDQPAMKTFTPMPMPGPAPLPAFTPPPAPQFTPYQAPTFLQPNFSVNQGQIAPPAPMNMKGMFGVR